MEIEEELKNMRQEEVPSSMHASIMHRAKLMRARPLLWTGFILCLGIFVATLWHINTRLVDAEFADMAQDLLEVFDWTPAYVSVILQNFLIIVAPTLVTGSLLSLIGSVYFGRKVLNA